MGHESAALALEVYSKVMTRKRDTGARMDALVRGADWARTGTNEHHDTNSLPAEKTNGAAIPLPKASFLSGR
jgi:hypothetical protein